VKQAVTSWIKQRTPEFFIDGMRKLVLGWEKCIERQGDYVEKEVYQFVAKILYFTSYFRLFKYMVPFSRNFTVCITYQPPRVYSYSIQIFRMKNLMMANIGPNM